MLWYDCDTSVTYSNNDDANIILVQLHVSDAYGTYLSALVSYEVEKWTSDASWIDFITHNFTNRGDIKLFQTSTSTNLFEQYFYTYTYL